MNYQKVLLEATNEDLIQELARRLKGVATGAIGEPSVNTARLQMIRTLKSSSPQGQPLEILRFLVKQGTPETMAQIADHMRTLGYKASRYYDASNALTDLRLAEVSQRGGEKSWVATQEGTDFLSIQRTSSQSESNVTKKARRAIFEHEDQMTFGTPVMSAQSFVTAFHRAFSAPLARSGSKFCQTGRKASTSEIYRVVRRIGIDNGLKVLHKQPPRSKNETLEMKRSRREPSDREFLWDIVWKYDDGRMALALESELSDYEHTVMWDFSKLLYAKSAAKVLVYTDYQKDVRSAVRTELIQHRHNAPGEEYILINLCNWKTRCLESTVFSFYNRDGAVDFHESSLSPLPWKS